MQNSGIFLRKMIEIVAEGDTFILHFAFFILHFYRAIGSINRNLICILSLLYYSIHYHYEQGVNKKEIYKYSIFSHRLQKSLAFYSRFCYNTLTSQGSYIGNTTASQAVKAGSIPVPCSM